MNSFEVRLCGMKRQDNGDDDYTDSPKPDYVSVFAVELDDNGALTGNDGGPDVDQDFPDWPSARAYADALSARLNCPIDAY